MKSGDLFADYGVICVGHVRRSEFGRSLAYMSGMKKCLCEDDAPKRSILLLIACTSMRPNVDETHATVTISRGAGVTSQSTYEFNIADGHVFATTMFARKHGTRNGENLQHGTEHEIVVVKLACGSVTSKEWFREFNEAQDKLGRAFAE